MRAAILAVGSEMLHFGRRDGNGDWLAARLERAGIAVVDRRTIPDETDRIARAIRDALDGAEVVIVTGGLGPTEDDRTRAAIAEAVGEPLERDEVRLGLLEALFSRHGRTMPPGQERQVERPPSASWIENPVGIAPGLLVRVGGRLLAALPGVPQEMRAMYAAGVEPHLPPAGALAQRALKIAGRTESSVDAQLSPFYGEPGVDVTILAAMDGIEIRLLARGRDAGDAFRRLASVEARMAEALGDDLYGRDEETLPGAAGAALAAARATVATAESCTAGLVAARLTEVAGSSVWFRGGIVVYDDGLKVELGGVRPETLGAHGAVSEPVARELAEAIRARCGTTFGVGITGVAGPGGATAEKPVGLVHVAVASQTGSDHWRLRLGGDRTLVRSRTAAFALDRVRRAAGGGRPR